MAAASKSGKRTAPTGAALRAGLGDLGGVDLDAGLPEPRAQLRDDLTDVIVELELDELNGTAKVLIDLMDDDEPCALSYLSDQLRRLSNRVAASAPRCGNSAPNWYAVEVKK